MADLQLEVERRDDGIFFRVIDPQEDHNEELHRLDDSSIEYLIARGLETFLKEELERLVARSKDGDNQEESRPTSSNEEPPTAPNEDDDREEGEWV